MQCCFSSGARHSLCPSFPGQLWTLRIIFPCLQPKICSSWLSFPCFASDGSTPSCRNRASSGMVCQVLFLYWTSSRNREKLLLHPCESTTLRHIVQISYSWCSAGPLLQPCTGPNLMSLKILPVLKGGVLALTFIYTIIK